MIENYHIWLYLSIFIGFIMACAVGANDVANAMGTAVGSRILTIRQAIIIAAVFEAAGALLASGEVAGTLRNQVIDLSSLNGDYLALVYGMLASLLAATTWLVLASSRGWPVSTTHSIVGAIAGFGVVELGVHGVQWVILRDIALSWVLAPVLAGFIAFALFFGIQRLVYGANDQLARARLVLAIYMFLLVVVNLGVTLVAGLHVFNIEIGHTVGWVLAGGVGLVASGLFWLYLGQHSRVDMAMSRRAVYDKIEDNFKWLAILAACAMAYSHGSNDVANAIGPLASIIDAISTGQVNVENVMPLWVVLIGVAGVIIGLAVYGKKVIATIGTRIMQLTPSRGFCVQLATSSTVVIASGVGMPVSTTQILVGALLGLGFARGLRSINLRVVRSIFLSWVVTVPAGFILAIVYYFLMRILF